MLYEAQGDYAKAEPLYQRALAIREKALGPDHPDIATSLNNLAELYMRQGDYAKAEPLYQRALAIREKALGPDHPDIATSLNNLALLYERRATTPRPSRSSGAPWPSTEKALGPDHPDTATSLNNLALLYSDMGDYAKAEPLYQRALAISEKALGPDHPDTATSLNNLAGLYRAWATTRRPSRSPARPRHQREGPRPRTIPDTAASLEQPGRPFISTTEQRPTAETLLGGRSKPSWQHWRTSWHSRRSANASPTRRRSSPTRCSPPGTRQDSRARCCTSKGVVLDSLLEDRLLAEASRRPEDEDTILALTIGEATGDAVIPRGATTHTTRAPLRASWERLEGRNSSDSSRHWPAVLPGSVGYAERSA